MLKYGNPSVRRWENKAQASETSNLAAGFTSATYRGVIGKTMLFLVLTLISAVATMFATRYGIFYIAETGQISDRAIIAFVVALIVAIVLMIVCSVAIAIKPQTAKIFGSIYAVIQGVFLGFVAAFLDMIMPYVTLAAVLGTMVVFVVCMLLYRAIGVRLKNNFVRVFATSLLCFLLVEAIMVPIMLLVPSEGMYEAVIWIQAITTFLCIIFASMTVIYDLQTIDRMVESGVDSKCEWGVAFSLTTSLVYLYLQILQLLMRIFALFSSSKNK